MSPKTHFNFKPPLGYCGDCIWLTDAGYCHRMPPTAQSASTPCWPIVGTLDWCGEFTPTIRETYSCGLKKCVRDICDRCPDPPPSVRPAEEDVAVLPGGYEPTGPMGHLTLTDSCPPGLPCVVCGAVNSPGAWVHWVHDAANDTRRWWCAGCLSKQLGLGKEVVQAAPEPAAPQFDVNKAREEMLAEIDKVLQASKHWVGGRLDTIKVLCKLCEAVPTTAPREMIPSGAALAPLAINTCVIAPRGRLGHIIAHTTDEKGRNYRVQHGNGKLVEYPAHEVDVAYGVSYKEEPKE